MILILIPVVAVAMVGIGAGVVAYRKSLDKHHHVLSSAYVRSFDILPALKEGDSQHCC